MFVTPESVFRAGGFGSVDRDFPVGKA